MTRLVTVGHGTASAEAFGALLRQAGVRAVVDVRTAPGSRRQPQFGRGGFERWLPGAGASYRWDGRLGGFRKPLPHSQNVALRHRSFRGYADHMRTPEFWAALDELLAEAARRASAVMCSESLWWRCHRRLIADAAMLVRGVDVRHLFHDGRLEPHVSTAGVRVDGEMLVYDAGETGRIFDASQ